MYRDAAFISIKLFINLNKIAKYRYRKIYRYLLIYTCMYVPKNNRYVPRYGLLVETLARFIFIRHECEEMRNNIKKSR